MMISHTSIVESSLGPITLFAGGSNGGLNQAKSFYLSQRAAVLLCSNRIMKHKNWNLLPSLDECGFNKDMELNIRIVGGQSASKNQFPWLARLGYKKKRGISFDCGATFINDHHVITAAHCTEGRQQSLKVVRVGANLPSLPTECTPQICPNVEDIKVAEIITHPKFNRSSLRNDISLVRLTRAPIRSAYVRPICLPMGNLFTKSFYGEKMTVAGWGITDSSAETMSSSLRHVQLPMRDRCLCEAEYAPIKLDETQFCVGLETGKDSCGGDSGGPLMYFGYQKYWKRCYLVGVVSFGKPICGEAPSVYTNTLTFMEWILDNIKEKEGVEEITEKQKKYGYWDNVRNISVRQVT